jgi:Recombination endonuclease VII
MKSTTCKESGCQGKGPFTRGWCRTHYGRWQKYGSIAERPLAKRPQCSLEAVARMRAAQKPARIPDCHPDRKHRGHGLCDSCHSTKWAKTHPLAKTGTLWNRLNPERARFVQRRASLKKVGTTPAQYEQLWFEQGGKCANANCSFTAPLEVPYFRQGLQVDHCHRTGLIRGLLCPRCNTALGHADDDLNTLRGLIEYLDAVKKKASAA